MVIKSEKSLTAKYRSELKIANIEDMRARKLILVDDDISMLRRIEEILKTERFQILKARNGVEGVRGVLRHHPDALIINGDMEYLSGIRMIKLLNAIGLNLPTLVVTNREIPAERIQATSKSLFQCPADRVESDLSSLFGKLLIKHKKSYRDISYSLSQSEFMGLLAHSDRKKILIVAESSLRKALFNELDRSGLYELYFAHDGEDALYKAVFFQPDLILNKIDFQEGNSIQLAQNLYILGHPFPIIFISERNDMETISKIKKIDGIQGYLLESEVIKNFDLLHQRLDAVFNLSNEEKDRLRENYRLMEPEKLQISKASSENIDFQSWIEDLE